MERYFDLYLNAGVSTPLVINANQYDKSETWLFTLYDETGIQFSPASGSIVGLKADGNTIMNAGTVNSSGQVVIQETEQMTAVAGKNEYELILDGTHGTANFVVLVERRPGDNAVPSESDISLISQAVQAASGIEAVLVLQNTVASLREEVNQWVAEHAGTTNETTLWEGDLDTDTPITLSHPATQYDVIAVYTNIANSDNSAVTPEAHYFRADEFKQGSVFISCGRADVETGASTEIITETFRLITNTTGTTTTVSLDTRKQVRWNGQASSNAGITFPTMPSVVRITGIKTVQDDQEIINARVGKNGTHYNTLKERLDAEAVIVDSSLTVSGAAADAKKTGDEISDLKSQIDDIEEQIEGGTDSGLTSAIKSALLQLAEKVGYENSADGNTVYNDLYDALYPAIVYTAITLNKSSLSFGSLGTTQSLTATTTPRGGNVTWSSSNTSVATVSQTGVVTSVGYGNATITATCGSVSATCSVAVAQATVTSISAVYTQSGTVYNDDSIDDLKDDLVVTAHWSNSTSSTVAKTDYTLSGTLTAGTSVITVSYGGKTTTFNVVVTQSVITGWYYPFNGSLLSEGTKDFGFTGTANYTTGFDTRQAYLHRVGTEGDSTTEVTAIKATGASEYPDMSGDFTMSFWHKSFTNLKGHPVAMSKYLGDTVFTAGPVTASSSAGHGWTIAHGSKSSKKYCGFTWWWYNDQLIIGIQNSTATTGNQLKLTPPSGFSTLTWHHYALTRSGNNMYFFVDGVKQATMTVSGALYSADQITVGSLFKQTSAEATDVNAMSNGDVVQDLYISETCKWTDDFDPTAIVYRDE